MTLPPAPMKPFDPHWVEPPPVPAGFLLRAAALVGGIIALLLGAIISLGTAILAVVGVLVAWWFYRRRGERLTRLGSWAAAVGACALGLVLVVGLLYLALPEDAVSEAVAAAEASDPAPLPAWLERLERRPPANTAADKLVNSTPFTVYFGLMGGMIAIAFLASLAGTMGWVGAFLLGFAVKGYWPLRPAETTEYI
jgi:hypothetical protein